MSCMNELQKQYATVLKQEYKDILNIHMTELMVLNYAHHVRNNDTYILRRDLQNVEHDNKIKQVSIFYITKTNLYSRPTNPLSYRFVNMAAYKNREYPVVSDGFVQDGDYHVRILYEYDHQTRPHPLLV
jgi:hypothetical protein